MAWTLASASVVRHRLCRSQVIMWDPRIPRRLPAPSAPSALYKRAEHQQVVVVPGRSHMIDTAPGEGWSGACLFCVLQTETPMSLNEQRSMSAHLCESVCVRMCLCVCECVWAVAAKLKQKSHYICTYVCAYIQICIYIYVSSVQTLRESCPCLAGGAAGAPMVTTVPAKCCCCMPVKSLWMQQQANPWAAIMFIIYLYTVAQVIALTK